MNKVKKFFKENIVFIIAIIIFAFVINYEVPYYIEAPGGVINLSKRMDNEYNKKEGSLNMLYVTEYKGNVATYLLAKIIKSWDIYEISNQQISNENAEEIYLRNRVMLDNSMQNAIFSAYTEAGKEVNITGTENIVLAVTKDNGFKIGDKIISIDGVTIDNVNAFKEYLSKVSVNKEITVIVNRNGKDTNIKLNVPEDKVLGVMIITNYLYDISDDIEFNFKGGEGGSSGGMILSLGVYSKITGIDLLKGRNIAGTGTIDMDGNVGEIDGVKYKIAGAVKNNMDVVLVSPYNYDEAIKVVNENKYDIEIIKVSTLKEAINYLNS